MKKFAYDVFISHSSKDKPVIRKLAQRLKADGLRVWFDEFEIKPGDMIGFKIEQGLEQSRTLVLVMSANAFASDWVTLERHTALFRNPTNTQRRFIPLRLDDAEIKETMKQFAYVDWRQKSDEEYVKLLNTCRTKLVDTKHAIKQSPTESPSTNLNILGHKKERSRKNKDIPNISQPQQEIPNSEITRFSTPLRRNKITIKIHEEYALKLDNQIGTAFHELNTYREGQGLQPYYTSNRFRPISPPIINDTGFEIQVAPINFAYLVMLTDPKVSANIKEYVQNKIDQMAIKMTEKFQNDLVLNTYNYNPLGIDILILTKDNRTLLRKRGASVLEAPGQWDCSFSGYCGDIDKRQDCTEFNEIDIGLTVEHEMRREIGIISADNREIIFTGFHRNSKTGALDMLGIWKTESTTEELVQLLTEKYPGTTIVFRTTKRAEEPFVWDAENLIIDFGYNIIAKALKEANFSLYNLIPEVFWCINLGLEAMGRRF